jgi:hypothetical protein
MTDFKVGDKVKVKQNMETYGLGYNKEYTINCSNAGISGDLITLEELPYAGSFYPWRFELVSSSESITDTLRDQDTQVALEKENVSETNTESLKGIESTYRIQATVNVEVGVTIRDLTHYLSRDKAYKLYQDLKVIFEEKLI